MLSLKRKEVAEVKNNMKSKISAIGAKLFENKVVVLFIVLSVFGVITSGKPMSYIVSEVMSRFSRNMFLVLALIIPILAGLGLNFGIVVGAMAAQIGIFCVAYFGYSGFGGLMLAFLIATPFALIFGWLLGNLYNKTKGAEMITGLVTGYLAEGLYQFVFLFCIGGVIPVEIKNMILVTGVGVKNTIDLTGTLKYALDTMNIITIFYIVFAVYIVMTLISMLLKKKHGQTTNAKQNISRIIGGFVLVGLTLVPPIAEYLSAEKLKLIVALQLCGVGFAAYALFEFIVAKFILKTEPKLKKLIAKIIVGAIILGITFVPPVIKACLMTTVPVSTYICIIGLCCFNNWLVNTKLGQDMRTVGQSRTVANSAGINVDRTRVIATMMSTVLACWGQIIYLQNLGTFATYYAHSNVGLYACASLLVGGASIQKATNKQAILGVILFHTLFIVAPLSATSLLNSSLIGEYFRVFLCYGVIAASLAMHAWKKVSKKNDKLIEA